MSVGVHREEIFHGLVEVAAAAPGSESERFVYVALATPND